MIIDIELETRCTVDVAMHMANAFTARARDLEKTASILKGKMPDEALDVCAMAVTL